MGVQRSRAIGAAAEKGGGVSNRTESGGRAGHGHVLGALVWVGQSRVI